MTPAEAARGLTRAAARTAVELSPLGLALPAWHLAAALWRDYLLTFPDPAAPAYALAYRGLARRRPRRARPPHRRRPRRPPPRPRRPGRGPRRPRRHRRSPPSSPSDRSGTASHPTSAVPPLLDLVRALDPAVAYAGALGFLAVAAGVRALRSERLRPADRPRVTRAASDNHGHADWLADRDARRLFPGPDPSSAASSSARPTASTGTAVARARPSTRPTRAAGARAAPPRSSSTPAAPAPPTPCVLAGSGGFKTTSVAVPTLLTWTGAAVVLDPSREIGPMVQRLPPAQARPPGRHPRPGRPGVRRLRRPRLDRPRLARSPRPIRGRGELDLRRDPRRRSRQAPSSSAKAARP